MKKNRIIFSISIIVLVFNLTACSSSNIKANDTQIKYENKQLKEYVVAIDEQIEKSEKLYATMVEAKNNNSKVENDKQIDYDSATIGNELKRLADEFNKTNFKDKVTIHNDLLMQYSYNISKATNLLAMMGVKNWDGYLLETYNETLNELEKIRPVYKESKDKLFNEVIYQE
ncbi:hypothetical protein [Clostridium gasigenes]|uniref:hypothetical protein n=1 Tax=Clostridium gasigenes TaxID=94869 RepID=UPI001C0AF3C7|nr:hypothetical protein [Clostridium gasigenes]MBU3102919.1 hypothetical protein [Clostridium gasigenes]